MNGLAQVLATTLRLVLKSRCCDHADACCDEWCSDCATEKHTRAMAWDVLRAAEEELK